MARSGARFDYVTVGHVTRDVIEDGTLSQPGGSAFYSALQAARLGLRTLIVTQGIPSEIEALLAPYLAELELLVIPAEHTTVLATSTAGPNRTQRMLAWAGSIVEPIELDTAILHIAPVARETPVSWQGLAGFVGITPQGLVRRWEQAERAPLLQRDTGSLLGYTPLTPPDSDLLLGDISSVELDPRLLPASFDAAVISEEECHNCHALFSAARRSGAHVAVTAGSRPTTVHPPASVGGQVVQTAIPPIVAVCDDIGAGDVFAAAFFVALADGRAPLEAAAFGNAAAAIRIAGVGPGAIARRAAIIP
ncbi:MAG TPA: PfkB family carbohydrate kinase [Solirubrobacteraceae bacterium]|nr:PfkB family carbohydrate kinase [Solirubrobacteraceae bacterium]